MAPVQAEGRLSSLPVLSCRCTSAYGDLASAELFDVSRATA
jgi:hypothetical protein